MTARFFQAIGVFVVSSIGIGLFWCGLIAAADAIARWRLRMEPPKNGVLHFRDGPVVVISAATPAAGIERLITDGQRRTEGAT